MNFLKSLAITLLSLILFLSLAAFSVVYMMGNTLLDPDFVAAEINRLDVPALAKTMFRIETPPGAPDLNEVINKTIVDLEPRIKEEVNTVIYTGYDYLLGKTEGLSVTISTEPLRNTLKENITQAFLDSPPPELKGRPSTVIRQYADDAYQQFAQDIPETIEFTESSIPPDVMDRLKLVRSYLSFYQIAFYGLIALMVLCAAGIFLISRDVKHTTRSIGTTILVYGVIGYAITFLLERFNVVEQMMGMTGDIPAWLQTWISQFIDNLMAPLETFDLALIITGVVLIVVSIVISIVYRQCQAEAES